MQGERAGVDDVGIGQLVTQLAGDAREMAQAEIALAKARAAFAVTRYKWAAIYFTVAGVLGLVASIALLVGLIISLATLIGPWLATLSVVGVVLVLAGILAMLGRTQLNRSVAS